MENAIPPRRKRQGILAKNSMKKMLLTIAFLIAPMSHAYFGNGPYSDTPVSSNSHNYSIFGGAALLDDHAGFTVGGTFPVSGQGFTSVIGQYTGITEHHNNHSLFSLGILTRLNGAGDLGVFLKASAFLSPSSHRHKSSTFGADAGILGEYLLHQFPLGIYAEAGYSLPISHDDSDLNGFSGSVGVRYHI